MRLVLSLYLLLRVVNGFLVPQKVFDLASKVPGHYEVIKGFFEQNGPDGSEIAVVSGNDLGLKPNFNWSDVVTTLAELNQAQDGSKYKLFLLARHGEGYHNIAPDLFNTTEWTCDLQMRDGKDGLEWFDASLTAEGEAQIKELSNIYEREIAKGMPLPQSFYVSPMRRTLQTFELTWSWFLNLNETKPIVKEYARETYGIGTESKRHTKTFIEDNWDYVEFEKGFTEEDLLWEQDRHESHQHRNYRARVLLNDIFVNDDNHIISLTSHRGTIRSILKVIHHRKWNLNTGGMIPVIIKASHYQPFEKPKLNKPWKTLPEICS